MADPVTCWETRLEDGRLLVVTLDRTSNRLMADVIEKGQRYGNEFVRTSIPAPWSEEAKVEFRKALRRQARREAKKGDAPVGAAPVTEEGA